MKWATGLMFIRMAEVIKSNFDSVRSPFLIVHDPYDKVNYYTIDFCHYARRYFHHHVLFVFSVLLTI